MLVYIQQIPYYVFVGILYKHIFHNGTGTRAIEDAETDLPARFMASVAIRYFKNTHSSCLNSQMQKYELSLYMFLIIFYFILPKKTFMLDYLLDFFFFLLEKEGESQIIWLMFGIFISTILAFGKYYVSLAVSVSYQPECIF